VAPSIVIGLIIVGSSDVILIVATPFTNEPAGILNTMVCGVTVATALASVMACRSDPAPVLLVLVTVKTLVVRVGVETDVFFRMAEGPSIAKAVGVPVKTAAYITVSITKIVFMSTWVVFY
jgi:hypothetical protein